MTLSLDICHERDARSSTCINEPCDDVEGLVALECAVSVNNPEVRSIRVADTVTTACEGVDELELSFRI